MSNFIIKKKKLSQYNTNKYYWLTSFDLYPYPYRHYLWIQKENFSLKLWIEITNKSILYYNAVGNDLDSNKR